MLPVAWLAAMWPLAKALSAAPGYAVSFASAPLNPEEISIVIFVVHNVPFKKKRNTDALDVAERLFVKLKKGSPGCLVCGAGLATESLRHLIWDCPAVREGWKTVLHLFADLRGLARPVLEAAGDWSTSRFVVSVLGTTPEWPVSAVPASEQQSLIWLVLKAELLSWVWRLRCKLIQQPGPGAPAAAAAPLPHSGADVVRMLQSVLRQRVLEERYFPTNGLVFEDWVARGALGRVDGGLGGAITFSPLLGG